MADALEEQERFCATAWPRLVGAVSHHCGDLHLAEELVQEALVRACQRWSHVSTLESPEGWAYRVAVNLSTSSWRRRRAERRARERHGPPDDAVDPVAVERQLEVRAALARLTPQQREVVVLRHQLDLSVEQVAEVLGSSPGAVRGLTHRAVGRLRALLDDPAGRDGPDERDGRDSRGEHDGHDRGQTPIRATEEVTDG